MIRRGDDRWWRILGLSHVVRILGHVVRIMTHTCEVHWRLLRGDFLRILEGEPPCIMDALSPEPLTAANRVAVANLLN